MEEEVWWLSARAVVRFQSGCGRVEEDHQCRSWRGNREVVWRFRGELFCSLGFSACRSVQHLGNSKKSDVIKFTCCLKSGFSEDVCGRPILGDVDELLSAAEDMSVVCVTQVACSTLHNGSSCVWVCVCCADAWCVLCIWGCGGLVSLSILIFWRFTKTTFFSFGRTVMLQVGLLCLNVQIWV